MSASFKKTAVKNYPRVGEKITRDTVYWKNLEFPVTKKEYGSITHINFSPVQPYQYAVTNSARVQIYDSESNQIERTISRFRETAYSATFRGDGRLLVAGGDEPVVKLFDLGSRALLRTFTGHNRPVHVTKFTSDGLHIMSGSDDNSVMIWDIATEEQVIRYNEHTDYIRTGTASKASKDIIVTGGYDHMVKLWDTRTAASVLTVNHGQPVESVLMFPGGGIFLSAGGNYINVWDALAGGKLLARLSNHHKTIMSMCFSCNHQRLLSASLDRHVKVYDVATYKVVHTLDYPGQILSLGVAPDDSVICVGMADGLLSIQHRKPEDTPDKKVKKKKKVSYRYSVKGKQYTPSKDDHVIEKRRREQLQKYDKYFKKFEHSKALDAGLDLRVRQTTPEVTVSVLQELIRRGGIHSALAGRDEKSLGIILKFLQKNISNPKYMTTLLDVATIILDLYSPQIGQSTVLDDYFLRLKLTVDREIGYMKMLMETMGTMDTLFASASQTDTPSDSLMKDSLPMLVPSKSAAVSV
ncbi:U3 small nucleolar RNA-associated protein 15 homolog [Lineus longissimus]|uniref:U3 small nucleolar RNA-associated protein 15 homolog n=1 Tax=Lineus longissimus TaxID=88925 RepID=UPI002B4C4A06